MFETSSSKIEKIVHQKYSADLFQDQKRKITEIKNINEQIDHPDKGLILSTNPNKKKSKKEDDDGSRIEYYKNKDLYVSLEDVDSWDYSSFDYEILDGEDIPIINSPFWPFEELGGYNKENGVDIRNIVLKSSTQFNMYK